MSRVLIFGVSPLPIENEKKITGPGIRTWQFTKPLLDDKHKICLISLRDRSAYFEDKPKSFNKIKSFEYHSLSEGKFKDMRFIQNLANHFRPDCIISISSLYVSEVAAAINISKPIWFDRGDLMAEAQLKSYNNRDDAIPREFYKLEKSILSRGDVFSAVSFSQKCAVIGRLGGAGRLNRRTLGYEFVHVIPCGIDNNEFKKTNTILRGKLVENNDFIILWSGGYNTWADVDTLFKGIESAMRRNDKIKFVSTGGSLENQDNFTYQRFLELIDKSKYKKRFIMLGWITANVLPDIYLESDLAINIDKNCYETLLGSRHRLLDWMKAGLPFITTTPSEFTKLLCNYKLAFGMEYGDSNMLAGLILEHSKNRRRLKHHSLRLKRFVNKNYTYEDTTLPLRRWVEKPAYSPDKLHTNGNYGRSPILLKNVDSLDEQEYKEMEKGLGETKKHSANLEQIRAELTKHSDNLTEQLKALTAHASGLDAQRAQLSEQLTTSVKQVEKLEAQIAYSEKECNQLKTENQDLKLTASNLTSQVHTLDAKAKELTQHSTNLEQIRAELTKHSDNLTEQLKALTAHASGLDAQRAQLSEQLTVSIREVEKFNKENNRINTEVNLLQKELNMANTSITKLQKDNEHVRNELSSCKDELDRIHETLIYRIYLRARTILSNVNKKQK